MRTTRTKAIVLRRTNFGEADRILQLLTPTGKCSVMARGVRREKSRLAGGVELFAICEVVISEGRGELGILTSSRLIQFFNHIVENYDRMQFAYQAIKLISNASEMIDSEEWYETLSETLAGLDALSLELDLIRTKFFLKYAALVGYELSLWNDINGKKLSPDFSYTYDVAEKGLRISETGDITPDHIKLLRLIESKPLKTLAQIGGIGQVIKTCYEVALQHAAI